MTLVAILTINLVILILNYLNVMSREMNMYLTLNEI